MPSLYDQVAYPGLVHPFATPDRLSVFGALFGLSVEPPPGATIVELGCGDGMNLLAIAQRFPDATVIGVDTSEVALATARRRLSTLGLGRVELLRLDLASPAEALPLPPCDYLIAVNLLSFLAPEVRRNTLALAGRILRPNGVALLSFLTWPGQHELAPLIGLMRHHVARVPEPAKRIAQARDIALWQLERVKKLHGDARARLLHDIVLAWHQMPDAVFLHEVLAEERHPLALTALVQEASTHGLAWLANARLDEPRGEHLPEDLREFVRGLPDPVTRQAYLDAFLMTRSRTSLFCKAGANVRRGASAHDFLAFHATSLVPSDEVADAHTVVTRTAVGDIRLSPAATALLRVLARARPHALALAAEVRNDNTLTAPEELGAATSELWLAGAVELTMSPPAFPPAPDRHPVANPLARVAAAEGRTTIPTLWHRELAVDEEVAAFIARSDGTVTWPEEAAPVLDALHAEGVFVVPPTP